MRFIEFLEARARRSDSLLCVGIDPRVESSAALREEGFRLVDACAEFAAAFKPNSAFFEAHGPEGLTALRDVIARVPDDVPVILDAKRGDIADTAAAYAKAAFDLYRAHAVTVSPYLGHDALAPFLERPERGAFILCKTSNPGADELQRLEVDGRPVYEIVARHASARSAEGNVGLVVGATDVEALAWVRGLAPDLWFLVPGVGAQGGELGAALAAGLRADGLGLLINVSRTLSQSPDPRLEARRLRDEINRLRRAAPTAPADGDAARWGLEGAYPLPALARDLFATECVRFGQFTLRSGSVSPLYIDLRRLIAYPDILRRVARAYARLLAGLRFDRLAAIPYAGVPIATAVALHMGRPLIYPRREVKDYGTQASIEGVYAPGERIAVLDDLATTGGTKIEAIRTLEKAGLVVEDIVVLVDREQGAREHLRAEGYRLHAVAGLRALLDAWRELELITLQQFSEVSEFLKAG